MDRLLVSLDQTRDERIRQVQLHQKALSEQQRMLAERAASASS